MIIFEFFNQVCNLKLLTDRAPKLPYKHVIMAFEHIHVRINGFLSQDEPLVNMKKRSFKSFEFIDTDQIVLDIFISFINDSFSLIFLKRAIFDLH